MVVNTGGRTDTVKFYTEWLLRRFEEGYVLSRNPVFPTHVSRFRLDPEVVDCVLFCSKDYAPLLPRLHRITSRFDAFFHFTITPYGPDVEANVPPADEAIETLLALERLVGAQRIAWRYDPVLLTERHTVEWHLEAFDELASRLAGHVNRCIFGFAYIDEVIRQNMPELVALDDASREALAHGMAQAAARRGLVLQACGEGSRWARYGIVSDGCVSPVLLDRAIGTPLRNVRPVKPRSGCFCMDSRCIGDYNTCQGGCRYCHSTRYLDARDANMARHDPASPLLIGGLEPGDRVSEASQESYRSFQESLF